MEEAQRGAPFTAVGTQYRSGIYYHDDAQKARLPQHLSVSFACASAATLPIRVRAAASCAEEV